MQPIHLARDWTSHPEMPLHLLMHTHFPASLGPTRLERSHTQHSLLGADPRLEDLMRILERYTII